VDPSWRRSTAHHAVIFGQRIIGALFGGGQGCRWVFSIVNNRNPASTTVLTWPCPTIMPAFAGLGTELSS
jgi:hypothetical protein